MVHHDHNSPYYSQSHSQLGLDSIATPNRFDTAESRATVSREHCSGSLKGKLSSAGDSGSGDGMSPKCEWCHINWPKFEMELQNLATLPPARVGPDLKGLRSKNFDGGEM